MGEAGGGGGVIDALLHNFCLALVEATQRVLGTFEVSELANRDLPRTTCVFCSLHPQEYFEVQSEIRKN